MNTQYLLIEVREIEEVMKVIKKASLIILEILDLFMKMHAARLVKFLSECQNV